jgi:hypothetical protein
LTAAEIVCALSRTLSLTHEIPQIFLHSHTFRLRVLSSSSDDDDDDDDDDDVDVVD